MWSPVTHLQQAAALGTDVSGARPVGRATGREDCPALEPKWGLGCEGSHVATTERPRAGLSLIQSCLQPQSESVVRGKDISDKRRRSSPRGAEGQKGGFTEKKPCSPFPGLEHGGLGVEWRRATTPAALTPFQAPSLCPALPSPAL